MLVRRLVFALTLSPVALAPAVADGIAWRSELKAAQADAKAAGQVVFVAVNMDGERANDRMAEEVYEDKRIMELAGLTVSLVASNDTHAGKGKTCPRFGEVTCEAHRRVDADVRGGVLAPDAGGYVVAPQHVFLAPDGSVILSVPYEMRAEELEWCFVTALREVDPQAKVEFSSKARAPKRLILGGLFTLGDEAEAAPLTREEALELIDKLKRGLVRGPELRKAQRRLAMADEPEARAYLLAALRTVAGRGGGGRGGGGGAGAGRADLRPQLMHWIGANSPTSYWEVCAEFIDDNDNPDLRHEAVVALEQLGARDALKAISARLRKTEDPRDEKNLLRALGTSGGDDKGARKALLKQAGRKKQPLLRTNAILALGWLTSHEDITAFLAEILADEEDPDRVAAVLAMAVTRDEAWIAPLEALLAGDPEPRFGGTVEDALAVLKGGPLKGIETRYMRAGEDLLTRERLFGADGGGGGGGEGGGRGGRGGETPPPGDDQRGA